MANVLKLHEAIVVVLINKPNRTATTEEIAKEINKRSLYKKKDLSEVEAGQIKLRAKLSNGAYHHLFEFIEPNIVQLKNQ
jgi:hypothetical protein